VRPPSKARAGLAALAFLFGAVAGVRAQAGAVRHVHDPAILRAGGHCYVFSTGKGVPVRRSKDLRRWESAGRVFAEDVPAWAAKEVPGSRDIWAPDISRFGGRYHLYYSVSTFGRQRSCIGLATNVTLDPADPKYRWLDRGMVLDSRPGRDDFNAIDPQLVLDEAGQPWLTWGSFWTGIKLVRLDAAGERPAAGAKVIALACRPRHKAVEAPFLIRRDGWWYLFVSFDQCCRGVDSTYKTMVGRSRKLTGPYVDYTGRPMLEGAATLLLAGHDQSKGPGHNSVLRTEHTDYLVHHMYDAAARGTPTLQIRPLIWAKDGWPLAGEPLGDGQRASRTLRAADLAGEWRHSVNYGEESVITLRAGGRVNDPKAPVTWALEGGVLRLRWPRPDPPGGAWVDECLVAPDGLTYLGRNQAGYVIRGVRDPKPKTRGDGPAGGASP